MPKLYFDFDDGRTRFTDEEGINFANIEAGRTEALQTLAEIVKDALPKSDQQEFSALVRNGSGNLVYRAKVTVSGEWNETRSV